jgi:hypothetical protein
MSARKTIKREGFLLLYARFNEARAMSAGKTLLREKFVSHFGIASMRPAQMSAGKTALKFSTFLTATWCFHGERCRLRHEIVCPRHGRSIHDVKKPVEIQHLIASRALPRKY